MPAAAIPAITGAIGVGSSIFGAANSASAASKAAAIQKQAAVDAGNKVEGAVRDSNPQIINNAANASDMALRAGGQVVDSAGQARSDVNNATANANGLLNPYAAAGSDASGTLQSGLQAGGDFNKTPTLADLQMDPGYAFRLAQGAKTLERSAFARGNGVSGTAGMDLTNYAQGAASQEYQNAFNRFETSTQNRFNNLNTVAGRGQQAAGQMGANLIGGAQYGGNITTDAYKSNLGANEFAGSQTYDAAKQTAANTIGGADQAANYLTQGANAQAAGQINSAAAWNQGLSGAANSVAGAGAMYLNNKNWENYLQNPAARH